MNTTVTIKLTVPQTNLALDVMKQEAASLESQTRPARGGLRGEDRRAAMQRAAELREIIGAIES